ncbi:DUF2213 domain-containing protein [Campylobacter sp. faydin G-105]|uniref:DUF2213 domain-containing protein n=1 Tax=Campylobacter anatolicus TaxID=2829105 RepID=UPI001B8F5404|nr:DUF2213 domain-containing protein [Campylobacter anatolicus]MBR8461485.1 DUF2213 domain-containing protein [Campylobacter anatolicus]
MKFNINNDGYIVTKAKMASIKPMKYDGAEIGQKPNVIYDVFRDEAEVFNDETIKSFEGKPLTLTHPDDDVTAANWKDIAIGHVQNVRREGDYLVGDVYINDENAIQIIKKYGIKEVSCGYDSKLVNKDGKIYQTQIRGNHLAVVAQGRAGKECRLMDKKFINERAKMEFKDRAKEATARLIKLKDAEDTSEELKEQSKALLDLLKEAGGIDEELKSVKAKLADFKKVNDEQTVTNTQNEPGSEVEELKEQILALKKENEELKQEIQRLKQEQESKEAIADAKANFSGVKITDAKSARDVYSAVILDTKALEPQELATLSDGEIKALYMGMRINAKKADGVNDVLNRLYDTNASKIDLNKKFGRS